MPGFLFSDFQLQIDYNRFAKLRKPKNYGLQADSTRFRPCRSGDVTHAIIWIPMESEH